MTSSSEVLTITSPENPFQSISIPESSRNGWKIWEWKMFLTIQLTPCGRPKVRSSMTGRRMWMLWGDCLDSRVLLLQVPIWEWRMNRHWILLVSIICNPLTNVTNEMYVLDTNRNGNLWLFDYQVPILLILLSICPFETCIFPSISHTFFWKDLSPPSGWQGLNSQQNHKIWKQNTL